MLGEGIQEALHREFMEELGVQIESSSLFYVNDYYQASAFSQTDQLISFYYKVTLDLNKINTELTQLPLDSVDSSDFERVAWIPLNELSEQSVTFPIDKNVVTILLESKMI
jgi:ADP-ribose pyrophosphatase YjhB (NUDIX family)